MKIVKWKSYGCYILIYILIWDFKWAYVALGFIEVRISEISFSPHFPGLQRIYYIRCTGIKEEYFLKWNWNWKHWIFWVWRSQGLSMLSASACFWPPYIFTTAVFRVRAYYSIAILPFCRKRCSCSCWTYPFISWAERKSVGSFWFTPYTPWRFIR